MCVLCELCRVRRAARPAAWLPLVRCSCAGAPRLREASPYRPSHAPLAVALAVALVVALVVAEQHVEVLLGTDVLAAAVVLAG